MKNFTLILLATFTFGSLHCQVFESDFSNWTDSSPDGWNGSKTNIGNANIVQADNNNGQGDYAVELVNEPSAHKRFTTQPLTVENGVNYEVTMSVRGTGDIRTGLFDNRDDGAGYVYSSYITINSTDWTTHTQSIIAAEDTDMAEFILSLRNTAGDQNIQVDHVIIETADLNAVSIYDIQYTTQPDGSSPLVGQTVLTGGVVTAVEAESGFFIQNGGGAWNGIYVFSFFYEPEIGDSVIFSALVEEYNSLTELTTVSGYTFISGGHEVTATNISTAQVNSEPFEGVLVKVWNAECTDEASGFGQYSVDDGTGECLINPDIYDHDAVFGEIYNITGVSTYSFGAFKIMPRFADDVEISTGISEVTTADGIRVFPNPVSETLNVQWTGNESGVVEYQLFDVSGQRVRTGVLQQPQGAVSMNGLTPGWYSLNLQDGDSLKHIRVVVER